MNEFKLMLALDTELSFTVENSIKGLLKLANTPTEYQNKGGVVGRYYKFPEKTLTLKQFLYLLSVLMMNPPDDYAVILVWEDGVQHFGSPSCFGMSTETRTIITTIHANDF